MSFENLDQFRAKLAADAALQKACVESFSAGKTEEVLAVARQLGFEFSADEVQQCLGDTELSDFELELVAAGVMMPPSMKLSHGGGISKG
ncbi:Nif11-like leader peptide family RiPP precursor [Azonexus sp.]|uniref:Nif11-like leader peptide family RiPP precursor n=1 Tax=Azonexus sp. TaxID=1872668 RepID=UPI0027BB016E|nr:Nif11-like leader peptide family RiPP precursor [Azonexus sp.]